MVGGLDATLLVFVAATTTTDGSSFTVVASSTVLVATFLVLVSDGSFLGAALGGCGCFELGGGAEEDGMDLRATVLDLLAGSPVPNNDLVATRISRRRFIVAMSVKLDTAAAVVVVVVAAPMAGAVATTGLDDATAFSVTVVEEAASWTGAISVAATLLAVLFVTVVVVSLSNFGKILWILAATLAALGVLLAASLRAAAAMLVVVLRSPLGLEHRSTATLAGWLVLFCFVEDDSTPPAGKTIFGFLLLCWGAVVHLRTASNCFCFTRSMTTAAFVSRPLLLPRKMEVGCGGGCFSVLVVALVVVVDSSGADLDTDAAFVATGGGLSLLLLLSSLRLVIWSPAELPPPPVAVRCAASALVVLAGGGAAAQPAAERFVPTGAGDAFADVVGSVVRGADVDDDDMLLLLLLIGWPKMTATETTHSQSVYDLSKLLVGVVFCWRMAGKWPEQHGGEPTPEHLATRVRISHGARRD